MREPMPNELGEVSIGDTIVGSILTDKLIVINKINCGDVWCYNCKYLDGLNKDDIIIVMSYFNYRRINL